jgi:GTP diphosphokinase / guanosine-3',5'-bis(diphosphate) 3'-diphosphatase
MEDLYASIGLGSRLAPLVARHFLAGQPHQAGSQESLPLAVEGTEGLVLDYAKCCRPVPGDDIRGLVSVGRGIVIHRLDCTHAQHHRKGAVQDWVELVWSEKVAGDYFAELRVQGENKRGVLARVAGQIAAGESSIENVQMAERVDQQSSDMRFLITVKNRTHLARVMRRIRRLEFIEKVVRV